MHKLTMVLVGGGLLLSGCKSIPEPEMTVPEPLRSQSHPYLLHRPALTLSDEAYHQSVGAYQINAVDLTGKQMYQMNQGSSWQTTGTAGLWFQLFFHNNINLAGDRVRHYSIRGEQDFDFAVTSSGLPAVQTQCQIRIFGQGSATLPNQVNSYNWQTSQQDLSYLACRLTQQGQISELTVERPLDGPTVLKLYQGKELIQLTPVLAAPELAAYQLSQAQGYLVQHGVATQAALQLSLDDPKIWLAGTEPAAQQQWLLAVLFSLQMFEWQDRQWPMNVSD